MRALLARFRSALAQVDAEASAYVSSPAGSQTDTKTITVLVTVAITLTVQHYASDAVNWIRLADLCHWLGWSAADAGLREQLSWVIAHPGRLLFWWATVTSACYVLIPLLVIRFILRERIRDYGLVSPQTFDGWQVYAGMIAFMLPIVWLVSWDRAFQAKYPFYPVERGAELPSAFWLWELAYAGQFVALEFFFRGFVVLGLRHRFGTYSVFVMMVPYCMIHFYKPVLETFAAIVAGIVLGYLSLKTRSVWLGASVHICVAWSMDTLALLRK
jgi:membrane protease YdiL (CAAX protease family)